MQATINHFSDKLHEEGKIDTELGLLINAYGGAIEEIKRLRHTAAAAVRLLQDKS
jgi:hypothetical protein